MAYKLGLDAKLFHGEAGNTATNEMTNVKDVTLNLESGDADITTRAAKGWRISAATLKEASLEFEMVWDTSDDGFKAVKNAFFNNTAIALFASDGDGNGLDADFVVSSFSRSEPLEEALTVSVTCKPTLIDRAPTWKDGTGGALGGGPSAFSFHHRRDWRDVGPRPRRGGGLANGATGRPGRDTARRRGDSGDGAKIRQQRRGKIWYNSQCFRLKIQETPHDKDKTI